MFKRIALLPLIASTLLLAGCGSAALDAPNAPSLNKHAGWAVLPFANNTSTPYAGLRAEHIAASLLGMHGVSDIMLAPSSSSSVLPVGAAEQDNAASLAWARKHGARYALTGSVNEWRYKAGLNGQPAVGFTVRVIRLSSGETVWSSAAAASGNSDQAASVLAQRTLARAMHRLLH